MSDIVLTVTELLDGIAVEGSGVAITVSDGGFSQTSGDARYVRTVNGDGPDVDGNVDVAGGGGTVESVNGVEPVAGDITLTASDVGADASGAAATAQAAAIAAAATDATTKANAAQAASQPVDSDLTAIAALDSTTAGALVTDGAGWIRKTYAQLKTALSLVKADVGLGSVDNTADTAKPVSTAQQTALDLKANLASPTFTGDPKAPTASPGDSDTSIATTAFVAAAVAAGGGGSPLLACVEYNPGTQTAYDTTSTTLADVDATNMAATFTVPASGNVLVRANAAMIIGGSPIAPLHVALRDSGGNIANSVQRVGYHPTAGLQTRFVYAKKLTGLTPSASYTVKLAYASAQAGQTASIVVGGTLFGAAIIEVWATS